MGSMLFLKFIRFKLCNLKNLKLSNIASIDEKIEFDSFISALNFCSSIENARFVYKKNLRSVFMYVNEEVVAIVSDKGVAPIRRKVA